MVEYAAQEGAEPFSICLLLNYPQDKVEESQASEFRVRAAMEAFPWLDIRYVKIGYKKETPIGQIRKDLWDGIMRVALADGLYSQPGTEFIGINHDIDTMQMGRHYIRNVQRFYLQKQKELFKSELAENPLPTAYTQVKHAYPFKTHPNVARALVWHDFTFRQQYRNGLYEEGLVVPFSTYAQRGGFDPQAVTHETHAFTPDAYVGIPGTAMDTSPRRYIVRLQEHGYKTIWTKDSFGPMDACRNNLDSAVDISKERLQDVVFETLETHLQTYVRGISPTKWQDIINEIVWMTIDGDSGLSAYEQGLPAIIRSRVEPRLRLARRVLREVVRLPIVADLVDESYIAHASHESAAEILKAAKKEAESYTQG